MIIGEKLIQELKDLKDYIETGAKDNVACGHDENSIEILNNAISELERKQKNDGWVPCSERLPEEERFYIVTYKFDDEEIYKCHELYYGVADGEINAGWYIDDDCERLYKPFTVIAWQPLPEKYKEGI